MIRSNGRDVKDYWGIEIYAANLEDNLQSLSNKVIEGRFKHNRPFKYFEPKSSGTHRTKTILPIEDAIIYQAIADTVATNNYQALAENNNFVFGSVLHQEVERGINILDEENPKFFFFEYYLPYYNRFVESVNNQMDDLNIQFKLETDITGFFDCIPHSKLLLALYEFGVEEEILDFFEIGLNMYSGTRDSITPGVGIPQGPAASFFFANLFLSKLDHKLNHEGYTYYRYMDDIRIYEEDEEQLYDALVEIDNYLKGNGLSLNSKKTSVQILEADREKEKLKSLNPSYNNFFEDEVKIRIEALKKKENISDFIEQAGDDIRVIETLYETLTTEELVAYCKNEIKEAEDFFLHEFKSLDSKTFLNNFRRLSDIQKKEIIYQTYRWRNANKILNEYDKPILNLNLIPIWIFLLEHFFWKANHFCWNLNLYGENKMIHQELLKLQASDRLKRYEWVRYQIFSNMIHLENVSQAELKKLYRSALSEKSPLVKMGMFLVLLRFVKPEFQLFNSIKNEIKEMKEPYIKQTLSGLMLRNENFDAIKYWLAL